jgi:hypothetical protein
MVNKIKGNKMKYSIENITSIDSVLEIITEENLKSAAQEAIEMSHFNTSLVLEIDEYGDGVITAEYEVNLPLTSVRNGVAINRYPFYDLTYLIEADTDENLVDTIMYDLPSIEDIKEMLDQCLSIDCSI